jgi:hypothetical protein
MYDYLVFKKVYQIRDMYVIAKLYFYRVRNG